MRTKGSSFRSPPSSLASHDRSVLAGGPLGPLPLTRRAILWETLYEQRLAAQRGQQTVTTYRWLRRDMLRIASRIAGRSLTLSQFLGDEGLLGQVLVTDEREDGGRCSKSTIAHRRTAIRSVATMLRPELQSALGRDPHDVIRDALRAVAERRGGGYRISAGTPRTRGGLTPNTRWTDPERGGTPRHHRGDGGCRRLARPPGSRVRDSTRGGRLTSNRTANTRRGGLSRPAGRPCPPAPTLSFGRPLRHRRCRRKCLLVGERDDQ